MKILGPSDLDGVPILSQKKEDYLLMQQQRLVGHINSILQADPYRIDYNLEVINVFATRKDVSATEIVNSVIESYREKGWIVPEPFLWFSFVWRLKLTLIKP